MAIPAIIGGGLMAGGLLGRAFSKKKKMSFGQFDPDPDGLALKQFELYNDPDSQFYRTGENAIRRTVADAQPTTASLLGASMAHGGSYGGSQSIANAQRQAHVNRAMDHGTTSLVDFYMKGQGMANQALGMHFQNRQSQIGGYANYRANREADNNQFWGQFMSGGAGLLGMWAGNQMTPPPGQYQSQAPGIGNEWMANRKKQNPGLYNETNMLPKGWGR
jgi:hypothetical protein